jgi:hypothetical protein
MLDAYRIQASAGPVTDKALEEILFRAAHGVVQSLAPYPREQRVALLPSVVRMLLATFLEDVGLRSPHTEDDRAGRKGKNHDHSAVCPSFSRRGATRVALVFPNQGR